MNTVFILAKHTLRELIRKKDFYVLLFLFIGLIAFFYSETFYGVEDISRYVKDVGFSLIILFSMIIAVSFSAKQIPSELESKTIYPLLAKPVSRVQFVLGKFFGSLFISVSTFTVFYLLYLSAVVLKGEGASFVLILQSYLFSILLLVLISSIAILFSLYLTISANITITFLFYFAIYWYNGVLRDFLSSSPSGVMRYIYSALYYILPHFEFYDMRTRLVHLWEALPLWVLVSVSVYTVLYVLLLMWIASLVFKKKEL